VAPRATEVKRSATDRRHREPDPKRHASANSHAWGTKRSADSSPSAATLVTQSTQKWRSQIVAPPPPPDSPPPAGHAPAGNPVLAPIPYQAPFPMVPPPWFFMPPPQPPQWMSNMMAPPPIIGQQQSVPRARGIVAQGQMTTEVIARSKRQEPARRSTTQPAAGSAAAPRTALRSNAIASTTQTPATTSAIAVIDVKPPVGHSASNGQPLGNDVGAPQQGVPDQP
jgi:hypothetical protein